MTVKELVQLLAEFPGDMDVVLMLEDEVVSDISYVDEGAMEDGSEEFVVIS